MKLYGWGIMATLLMLSGCASMSVEQCQTANWHKLGELDGARGQASQLHRHYKACQKANIIPDQAAYSQGYQQGLNYYCVPKRVFEAALQGVGNYEYCALEQRDQLKPFYQTATQYYQAKKQTLNMQQRITDVSQHLRDPKLSEKDREYYQKEWRRLRIEYPKISRDFEEIQQTFYEFKQRHQL